MSRPAGALAAVLAAGLLAGGCAGWRPTWPPTLPWSKSASDAPATATAPASSTSSSEPYGPPSRDVTRRGDPAQMVERAAALAHEGKPLAARDLYERVIRDYPQDPIRPDALFALGQLQCDPASPLRDYRAAYITFGRVLSEHPQSRWDADAKLWRAMLNEIMARDEEAAKLRTQLQRLKRIEVELDRSR